MEERKIYASKLPEKKDLEAIVQHFDQRYLKVNLPYSAFVHESDVGLIPKICKGMKIIGNFEESDLPIGVISAKKGNYYMPYLPCANITWEGWKATILAFEGLLKEAGFTVHQVIPSVVEEAITSGDFTLI